MFPSEIFSYQYPRSKWRPRFFSFTELNIRLILCHQTWYGCQIHELKKEDISVKTSQKGGQKVKYVIFKTKSQFENQIFGRTIGRTGPKKEYMSSKRRTSGNLSMVAGNSFLEGPGILFLPGSVHKLRFHQNFSRLRLRPKVD
jgi:hypothetical protein